jgi:hypothetical protein
MTNILLLGGSGLVGGESLRIALNHNSVRRVVAPTRLPLPAHPRLVNSVSSNLGLSFPMWLSGQVSPSFVIDGGTVPTA